MTGLDWVDMTEQNMLLKQKQPRRHPLVILKRGGTGPDLSDPSRNNRHPAGSGRDDAGGGQTVTIIRAGTTNQPRHVTDSSHDYVDSFSPDLVTPGSECSVGMVHHARLPVDRSSSLPYPTSSRYAVRSTRKLRALEEDKLSMYWDENYFRRLLTLYPDADTRSPPGSHSSPSSP